MAIPNPWVWRHDGTLQCSGAAGESLQEAREQLETVIGAQNVVRGEKRKLPGVIIAMCGASTGQVNAFELTPYGFWLLFHGIVGPIEFRPWVATVPVQMHGNGGGQLAFDGLAQAKLDKENVAFVGVAAGGPSAIDQLYGRKCRVYNVGDALTDDYLPERFNIGLVAGRIREMWFG